ncbi:hypothetical protein O9K51_05892 [Purpureocillium lavendulum]|uniref:Uncharacterized protein n=1 Tax=Purpureocillium lavendulum TaxID=1247861 RepID=A0AB34FT91_9HYPO|nr:hypothetical protein O9K51_05892 [Purpureocillium lavendulum]
MSSSEHGSRTAEPAPAAANDDSDAEAPEQNPPSSEDEGASWDDPTQGDIFAPIFDDVATIERVCISFDSYLHLAVHLGLMREPPRQLPYRVFFDEDQNGNLAVFVADTPDPNSFDELSAPEQEAMRSELRAWPFRDIPPPVATYPMLDEQIETIFDELYPFMEVMLGDDVVEDLMRRIRLAPLWCRPSVLELFVAFQELIREAALYRVE